MANDGNGNRMAVETGLDQQNTVTRENIDIGWGIAHTGKSIFFLETWGQRQG
jgi:hypothetical protein